VQALRTAAAARQRATAPPVLGKTITLLVTVGVVLFLSLFVRRSGQPVHYNFSDPRGVVTVVSALLLSMAGAFALASASLSHDRNRRDALAWLLFAGGLTFLAADDLLQFHMWLGHQLDRRLPTPPGTHGWNDLVVVGYGLVAIPVAIVALPTLLALPGVSRLLWLAFAFYLMHTLMDLFAPHRRSMIILEESMKVFSGACLLLASYVGLMGVARGGRQSANLARRHESS
jgi:hypothetical protein